MTQSPSEPPNDPRPVEPPTSGPSRPLSFDEMVALLAAFLTLGSILFWGMSRGNMNIFDDAVAGVDTSGADTSEADTSEAAPPAERSGLFGFGAEEPAEPEAIGGAVAPPPGVDVEPPLSARERLALRAAARRREVADSRRDRRFGFGAVTAGTAAGVAANPDGVAAEDVQSPDTAASTTTTGVAPSAAATADPQDAINFQDVPDNYWAKPYIDALSSRGLTSGFEDGLFRPDQPVTRAQIANLVSRSFDLEADKENLAFSDVANDYWARETIEETVKGGFMTGFPDNTFAPDDPVTRAQAFTTLVTGLGIEPPADVPETISRYTDANAIPKWATDKMAAATEGSLVINHPNLDQLNPEQPTTRAELAAMIYQALVKQGAVEPIESEYLVKP